MSLVLAFDCAVSGLGIAVVRDGARLAGLAEERSGPGGAAVARHRDGPRRGRRRAARPVADCRHHRTGKLYRRARRPGRGARPRRRARRAAGGPRHDIGVAGAGQAARAGRRCRHRQPSRRLVLRHRRGPGWRKDEPAPFVAAAPELAARLGGRACLVIGSGAQTLAPQLVAAGIDAMAEQALPDPVTIARLAADAGAEAWRARNKREGLPRPLYLRGVSITLPDGARRTVD